MDKNAYKDAIYGQVAQLARGLSNPHRLEMLDLLASGAKTVEQLARAARISTANASQHLQVLKHARLVRSLRKGHFIYYSLSSPAVYGVVKAFRELAIAQHADTRSTIEDFRKQYQSEQTLTLEAALGLEDVCLIDVRPVEEFEQGAIPGAVSVPIAELEERVWELPTDKLIVAYCRGTACTYADEAVKLLRGRGFRAARIEETYMDYLMQEQGK